MEEDQIQELSEVVQSSNLNFLFGAGASFPFLPLLNSIEKDLNAATTPNEREGHYKEYLTKVMLPNKKVLSRKAAAEDSFNKTYSAYCRFFRGLVEILLKRKSTILSKQANIFTTNIDVLLETCLEDLKVDYNDGFAGRFVPVFGLANYKKSIHQRSLHFDHSTEIPVINILKIHGSLTWALDSISNSITFAAGLSHLADGLEDKTGAEFIEGYKKILVVNPEESKHLESVLVLYYSELLRLYSSELEKENAVLFTIGFSMEDRHIREITLRAAKSNPTLRIILSCSRRSRAAMAAKMQIEQHPNIQVIVPPDEAKFTLNHFNECYMEKTILKKS